MYQVKGHALILAAVALGAVASFEILDSTAPTRALRAGPVAAVAAPPPAADVAEPALKPLPASTAQAQYTRVLVSPADREMLARDIQRELRRMGCYRGDIDGTWGPQSRQAMGAFTAALKLRIPFDAPDEMMLRLVQGQAARVCAGPDLDPEQAYATPSLAPPPRLVQPPAEVKRAPRRAPGTEAKAGVPETQVADSMPPAAPRRIERAAPPPPPSATPAIVRNLMQTVSNVFGPLGF